jgi:hypothetical protein
MPSPKHVVGGLSRRWKNVLSNAAIGYGLGGTRGALIGSALGSANIGFFKGGSRCMSKLAGGRLKKRSPRAFIKYIRGVSDADLLSMYREFKSERRMHSTLFDVVREIERRGLTSRSR